jgi:hypothetical protein
MVLLAGSFKQENVTFLSEAFLKGGRVGRVKAERYPYERGEIASNSS